MRTEIDELRSKSVRNQSGTERNNVQLAEIVNTHSTDVCVDTATTEEMPADWVCSARSARHRRAPFMSAPAQCQLMPRALLRTVFDVSLSKNSDMYAPNHYRQLTVPMSGHSSRNSFVQNVLPLVRLAKTKQTARRDRDDRRRDDERRSGDQRSEERRDREPTKPTARRRRRGTPPLEKYVCIFCQKENTQQINHKRHLVMQHHCRIDGTPATAEDIAQARAWSSRVPTGRGDQYKSKEFVETTGSEDDDDVMPEPTTPRRRKSLLPPRSKPARRDRSVLPRRSAISPPRPSTS